MIAGNWKENQEKSRRSGEVLNFFLKYKKNNHLFFPTAVCYQFVEEDPSQNDTDYVCKAVLCWVSFYEGSFPNMKFDKLLGFGFYHVNSVFCRFLV